MSKLRLPALRSRAIRFEEFAQDMLGIRLRPYQLEAAQAVIDSIREHAGRSIVVMFARQSGKDELSANLKAYLLARRHTQEVGIVEVNPTYKPQTINAIERLENRLRSAALRRMRWRKRSDFMRMVGRATVTFLSGDGSANVVGAVASLVLIVNEAQDIEPAVYDRNFAPMAASTNATRLFMGTAWTSRTLLGREVRAARQAEQADGIRRVFLYDADDVRRLVPDYGKYVDEQIGRLGRGHPLIRTQYFNEEIDAQAGMFNAARRAMMRCDAPHPAFGHPPDLTSASLRQNGEGPASPPWPSAVPPIWSSQSSDKMGGLVGPGLCVFAIDVAGQDEATFHNPDEQLLRNPGRDAVALTIAGVDLCAMQTLQAPIFRIVHRELWTGLNHLTVFGKVLALADQWRPQHIIVDATGVGEGLWAMLDKHFPTRVIPVKFSAQKKSEIGYRFLAMIETGRIRDCCPTPDVDKQYAACTSEVLTGPQHTLRWGVPEGTRDADGALIHDDIVMADALLAEADMLEWTIRSETLVIPRADPLQEMSHF